MDDKLKELQQVLIDRKRTQRYRYFIPNGKGEEFINTVGSLEYFVTLYNAANGVGKTCTAVNVLAHLFWPTKENGFFDAPMFKSWNFPKRGRIVTEPTSVDTIINELKYWFPQGKYSAEKKGKHYEKKWTTDTGWEFDIMTYDQDPKEFESATLGFIWFDEPPPQSIYKASIARLRKGGLAWITATPLSGSEWMYDQIICNKEEGVGKRTYITADVEAACKIHGVRGHLEHNHILKIIEQYSDDEKQARVFGKFQHLTGLIFKQFDRRIHVIKPFLVQPESMCVFNYLDPHPRNPDAVLWLGVDRKGTKYIIDELWLKCQGGTKELAMRIKQKDSMYRVEDWRIDPSAMIEDQHTQASLARRLEEYGLTYREATKMRTLADRRISDALSYQEVNGEMIKAPELYIFENCQRTIYEFEHYRWDEWLGKSADKHDQKQKPVDKDDHMIENVGRGLFSEPVFIPMRQEQETYIAPQYDPY